MAKARREVTEKLKLVDLIIELRDARTPNSSENPMLRDIVDQKQKLIILMKNDLADQQKTTEWLTHFNKTDTAIAVNINDKKDIEKIINTVHKLSEERIEKAQKRGIHARATRAMVIGIPNVGKSTLINRLANRKIAKTGDRPGITKRQLWIKVGKVFELLDTPGILWPKFDDELTAYKLAAIGTIKDEILPLQDVAAYAINFMREAYPDELYARYSVIKDLDDMWDIFEAIGHRYGALESGGKVNFDKVANTILRDLRTGKFTKVTLETVDSFTN